MKHQLPLTVIALAALTGSTASALPVSMTLVLDAIVTSNSFTPEMDAIEGVGTRFSTVSVGDPFTVFASLNTDPGFLNVPDFGTDMGDSDGARKPVEELNAFDSFGTLLGWEGFVWASLEKTGNTLTADTASGPNVFDLAFTLDTVAWSGTLNI